MKKTYLQQGDVLLFPAKIPGKATQSTKPDHMSGIVQRGEHTGHAHRLASSSFARAFTDSLTPVTPTFAFFEHDGKTYVSLNEPTLLRHEEHKAFEVPPGEYEIKIVREYDHFAEEARNVAD